MSSNVTVVFVLTGALKGRTILLGKKYQFSNGRLTLSGQAEQIALHARALERNWSAFPEGSDKLKEAEGHGKRDVPPNGGRVSGDGQPEGGGAPSGEGSAEGSGDADPDAGAAGVSTAGNGQPEGVTGDGDQKPEVNEKLKRAVMALDPKQDSDWTKSGQPAMSAVEKLYGSANITRADVDAVAPGYVRPAAEG